MQAALLASEDKDLLSLQVSLSGLKTGTVEGMLL
jgi:hypothetical protein